MGRKGAIEAFLLLSLLITATSSASAAAGWFDVRWQYRNAVAINNASNSKDLEQYQISLELDNRGLDFTKMKSDGSDLRVTDADGTTPIPYYITAFATGLHAMWVKVPRIPKNSSKTIYLYYGNSRPGTFLLPPTGTFRRPTKRVDGGCAENMVFDDATQRYYQAVGDTTDGPIRLLSAEAPTESAGAPTGKAWTDLGVILWPAGGTAWDSLYVATPHLFKWQGTWYLYYTGGREEDFMQIGYATAPYVTGPYTRRSPNLPVLRHGANFGEFDYYLAFEPYVFQLASPLPNGHSWVLVYCGDQGGFHRRSEQVGYATSTSPTGTWTKYNDGSDTSCPSGCGTPVLEFDEVPSASAGTLADPFVFGPVDGWYYIGYAGGSGAGTKGNSSDPPWNISMARTRDFVQFEKLGNILTRGARGSWDESNAHRGAVILSGDTYYLPYYGLEPGADPDRDPPVPGWGVASMPALSTAKGYDPMGVFDFYDDFSDPDLPRWGLPSGEGGSCSVANGVLTLNSGTSNWGSYRSLVGSREFGAGYLADWSSRSAYVDIFGNYAGEGGLGLDDLSSVIRLMNYDSPERHWQMSVGWDIRDMAQVADTGWHRHVAALVSSSTAAFQNDWAPLQTMSTSMPTVALKPWLFSWAAPNRQMSMEVDYYLVRKFANPEPSNSIGARESAPYWSPGPFTTGLLAHWRMDESSGTTVGDSAGAHAGTASNTTIVTGKFGNARSFNGSTSKITINTAVNYAGSTYSISAWVRPTSWNSLVSTILHKEGQYTLSFNASGRLSYADSSMWSYAFFGGFGNAALGSWHHVVLVRSGPTVTLYLDGSQLISKPFGGDIVAGPQAEIIGCYTTTGCTTLSPGPGFAGRIDDVAMWSRALSGAEVAYLYNGGTGRTF
jgi:hypothetical protein